ncbi:hypothetical protein SELMODRAFT_439060 [Selaginella moellendorffii]|uniref:PCI domain-containing protein n=1 Tax=Selaginella moellendorffii TaxID=88036 RepID=D8R249_SELML|nr:hypothetical protein SELMODRAFT_439060 [Selaginella moellendorffii]
MMTQSRGFRGGRGDFGADDDGSERIQRPSTADSYYRRPRSDLSDGQFGNLDFKPKGNFESDGFQNASGGGRFWGDHRGGFGNARGGGRFWSDQRDGFGNARGGGRFWGDQRCDFENPGFQDGGQRFTRFENFRGGRGGNANPRQGGSSHFDNNSYGNFRRENYAAQIYGSGNIQSSRGSEDYYKRNGAGSFERNPYRGNGRGNSSSFRNVNNHQQQQQSFNEQKNSQRWTKRSDHVKNSKDHGLSPRKSAETRSHGVSTHEFPKENINSENFGEFGEPSSTRDRKHSPVKLSSDYLLMLYRQAVLTRENDDDWPHIVGNCPDMCPAEEREKRSRLRDLAVFERLDSNQSKTTKELAVKKFCRTFSGKSLKESDVRPLPVLCRTMMHLLRILDVDDYPFEVVHDFLFDRTRAIRQELSMQRITDKLAVSVYENIVRFHIVSERELRQLRTSGKVFDSHLNQQQLSKALLSLLNLYLILGDSSKSLENEAEFYSYYVLLNLGQPQQLTLWFQSVRPALLKSSDVEFSRSVLRCYRQDNFRGFFRLVTKATYLQACLMELYFNEVRASAIKMINYGAYKLHPFPLSDIAEFLLMTVDDMQEFCALHGVAVSNDAHLLAKQSEFTPPQQLVRQYLCQVIEEKRPAKFQELCSDLTTIFHFAVAVSTGCIVFVLAERTTIHEYILVKRAGGSSAKVYTRRVELSWIIIRIEKTYLRGNPSVSERQTYSVQLIALYALDSGQAGAPMEIALMCVYTLSQQQLASRKWQMPEKKKEGDLLSKAKEVLRFSSSAFGHYGRAQKDSGS